VVKSGILRFERCIVFGLATLALLPLLARTPALAQSQKPLTNADIVDMVASKLGDQIVLNAIRDAKARAFDLTPSGLIGLKRAGVSDAVIVAMQQSQTNTAQSAPAVPTSAPTTAARISGQVVFRGTPPPPTEISMNADPACLRVASSPTTSQSLIVSAQGGLANAFVYVKDGLNPSHPFETPSEPVQLDQKGCQFVPRVLGVRVGQPLLIVNSDPTLQNIHARPRLSPEFNIGQPIQGMKTTHTFSVPEIMIPVRDDVHGWKAAFVGVMAHPYFAVTAADGSFAIAGLPPGNYTIEAWHETLGTVTGRVTVGAQGGTVRLELGGAAAQTVAPPRESSGDRRDSGLPNQASDPESDSGIGHAGPVS
jgi:hypothetical protein